MSHLVRGLLPAALILGAGSCCHHPGHGRVGDDRFVPTCSAVEVVGARERTAACFEEKQQLCGGAQTCDYWGCCNMLRSRLADAGLDERNALCEPRCTGAARP